MADHVLSTHQLSLFIDPEEHIANMPRSTDAYAESMPDMWSRKETESREPEGYGHGSGLYDRIKAGEQIRNPIQVQLGHSTYLDRQYEGHHRAAAGAAVQRENREAGKPNPQVHIPVEYTQQHGSPNWLEDRRLDMAGAGMWMTPAEKDDRHVEVQLRNQMASRQRMRFYEQPTAERAGLVGVLGSPQPIRGGGGLPAVAASGEESSWRGERRRLDAKEAARMAALGAPTGGNIKQPDSALERLLNEEESIARRLHGG